MVDQKELNKAKELRAQGYSTKDIADMMGKSQRTIQRYVAASDLLETLDDESIEIESNLSDSKEYDEVYDWQSKAAYNSKFGVVGVISDLHLPFSDIKYLDWLIETFKKWNVTKIVCLGDAVDNHTISVHATSPDAMGTLTEYKKALDILSKYYKVFPYVKYCIGNHCSRIIKKAAVNGIPSEFLKSFRDLYNVPKTWDIADKHIINNVLYTHGTQFASRNAITSVTSITHKSTVLGHSHTQGGVFYTNSGFDELFCMYCGCLLNESSYAFNYAKDNKYKPVLGCGIVVDETEAYFIPYKED